MLHCEGAINAGVSLARGATLAVLAGAGLSLTTACPPPHGSRDHAGSTPLERLRPAPLGKLVGLLSDELKRSLAMLRVRSRPDIRILYLGYTARDQRSLSLVASNGRISKDSTSCRRRLSVELRVGNTTHESSLRQVRYNQSAGEMVQLVLPLTDDKAAVQTVAWLATSRAYQRAVQVLQDKEQRERRQRERAAARARSAGPRPAPGGPGPPPAKRTPRQRPGVRPRPRQPVYSAAKPVRLVGPRARLPLFRHAWRKRLRRDSAEFRRFPWLRETALMLAAHAGNRTMVTSEGTVLQLPRAQCNLELLARSFAPDGMKLEVRRLFVGRTAADLPSSSRLRREVRNIAATLKALREAPLAEPYQGPAIFRGQAAAVLFHEVLGHSLEGHRPPQLGRKWRALWRPGQRIMPTFLSAFDDPRLGRINGTTLSGAYRVDDEGVLARRVNLVQKGVLRALLASRRINPFVTTSNGHGRGALNRRAVARQGNLVVVPAGGVSIRELRARLLREVRRQKKTYGLIISEALEGQLYASGYSWLNAIVVHQVFADKRPDRLIRGLQPVGRPSDILQGILATGRKQATFNGTCNAESGRVTVSATAPSVLVRSIGTIRLQAGKQPRVTTLPKKARP